MSVDDAPATRGAILSWGEASDSELQRINTFARVPLTRDQVSVIDVIPSSTDHDSYWTQMDAETTLRNFADESQAGVPILVNHGKMRGGGGLFGGGKTDMPVGRSFIGQYLVSPLTTPRGDTIDASADAPKVYSAAYMVRGLNTAAISSDDVIRGIEAGIITDASVGMGDTKSSLGRYAQGMYWRCDECGEDLMRSRKCDHWPGMTVIDEDTGKKHRATATVMHAGLQEYSPVWRGSNPTAQMVRAMEDRLERGVLSAADVAELDVLTQRSMSTDIDWTRFKRQHRGVDVESTKDTSMPPEQTTGQSSSDRANTMTDLMDDTTDADLGRGEGQQGDTGTGSGDGSDDRGTGADAGASGTSDSGATLPQPVLARLVENSITDLATLDRLMERAADGDAYKEALVELAHTNGVRAYGANYNRDIQDKMLRSLTVAELQTQVETVKAAARERFRKHPTNDPDDEEARKLREQFGGRQTAPHGQRPSGASTDAPAARGGDEQIDAALYRPARSVVAGKAAGR